MHLPRIYMGISKNYGPQIKLQYTMILVITVSPKKRSLILGSPHIRNHQYIPYGNPHCMAQQSLLTQTGRRTTKR